MLIGDLEPDPWAFGDALRQAGAVGWGARELLLCHTSPLILRSEQLLSTG